MPGVLAASKVQPEAGDAVIVTGTGFTAAGVVNLTAVHDGADSIEVRWSVTAVAGAITACTIVPGAAGHVTVTAHDVTANTDTQLVMQVFD